MNKCISSESEYILKKNNINRDILDDWIEKVSQMNKNIRLEYFTTIPDSYLIQYTEVLEEIENAMPTEIEEPHYKVSAADLKNEEKELETSNKKVLSSIATDEKGNIIGINRVFINNSDLSSIRQWQIGIVKTYRGKGIAKWMKSDMYKKLFEEYSELESIGSDTHPSNKSMITIMKSIGFEYLYTIKEYEDGRKVKI